MNAKKQRPARRAFLGALTVAICLAGSTVALFGTLVLPLHEWRYAVLGSFALAVVLAVVPGWMHGRFLWFTVKKGGMLLWILGGQALAGAIFFRLFLYHFSGRPSSELPCVEAFIIVAATVLVFSSSWAVGMALTPGSKRVPAGRRAFAIVLLYGSLIVGFLLMYVLPPPRGKIPMVWRPRLEQVPLSEFIRENRSAFPGRYAIEETEDGGIRIEYHALGVRSHHLMPYDDVILAEGNSVGFPDGRVTVEGLDLFCRTPHQRAPAGEPMYAGERGGLFGWFSHEPKDDNPMFQLEWVGGVQLDGTPLAEPLHGRERSLIDWWAMWGHVVIRMEGEVRPFYRGPRDDLISVPSGIQVAGFYSAYPNDEEQPDGTRLSVLNLRYRRPIPGPLEFRLCVRRGTEGAHKLPNELGATLETERDIIHLVTVLEGTWDRDSSGQKDFHLNLYPREEADPEPSATAVFATLAPTADPPRWEVSAAMKNGAMIASTNVHPGYGFLRAKFPCDADEIEGFRFREKPYVSQVRFQVPGMSFFPKENHGVDDLLDLRVPYMVLTTFDLQCLFSDSGADIGYLASFSPLEPPMEDSINATVREILDRYYPNSWRVVKGNVEIGSRETLATRLRDAWRWRRGPEEAGVLW